MIVKDSKSREQAGAAHDPMLWFQDVSVKKMLCSISIVGGPALAGIFSFFSLRFFRNAMLVVQATLQTILSEYRAPISVASNHSRRTNRQRKTTCWESVIAKNVLEVSHILYQAPIPQSYSYPWHDIHYIQYVSSASQVWEPVIHPWCKVSFCLQFSHFPLLEDRWRGIGTNLLENYYYISRLSKAKTLTEVIYREGSNGFVVAALCGR